jgi:hypothetical protein
VRCLIKVSVAKKILYLGIALGIALALGGATYWF